MEFYENMEAERERIQKFISRFGWTSDHNLDWCIDAAGEGAKPVFVEFSDGTGLLAHKYPNQWRIWSNPLSERNVAAQKISEFSKFILTEDIKEVWCDDISDEIYPELEKDKSLKLNDIYYSLYWPVLDMEKYDVSLAGGNFKRIRNAKNKFYREHDIKILKTDEVPKNELLKIVDAWKEKIMKKQDLVDIADLKYRKAIQNGFKAFTTSRVMVVDGWPVGFNAGYEVPSHPGRFAGVIGLHDYSVKELGRILWLEDLAWIKKAGYKELDMQGNEEGPELKAKTQYGAAIERKTDTFSIVKK